MVQMKSIARKALIKSARKNNLLNQEDGGESTPANAVFEYFKQVKNKKAEINKLVILEFKPNVFKNRMRQQEVAKKHAAKHIFWKTLIEETSEVENLISEADLAFKDKKELIMNGDDSADKKEKKKSVKQLRNLWKDKISEIKTTYPNGYANCQAIFKTENAITF